MTAKLDELNALKKEWDALQPLAAEREARLWQKLRLEWNYHSNHIEGNTLTYGETELLLLHDRTTGNHSHREYLEMKAHDLAIEYVVKLAADPTRLLAEADIRDLNRILLKEPFWKPAETVDGQPTRKEIIPGQYKSTPNNVRTATGDMFFFASVEDTPPKMQALAEWLRRELEQPALPDLIFAARLHHEFVLIHPFDDGNGRVARLLVNYVLQRAGYPPIIVPSEQKSEYLTALRLADAGDMAPLEEYLTGRAIWALQLGIKAARGESIEEPSDVEKHVRIFIKEQEARKNGETGPTSEAIQSLLEISIIPLLEKIERKLLQLAPLFKKVTVSTWVRGDGDYDKERISQAILRKAALKEPANVYFTFKGYQGDSATAFDLGTAIEVHFALDQYRIVHGGKIRVANPYSKVILPDEADKISSDILSTCFDSVRKEAQKSLG